MRLSKVTAYGASIAIAAALLAGCSGGATPAVSSLPGSVGITPMARITGPVAVHHTLHQFPDFKGMMGKDNPRLRWLEIMASGKMANSQGKKFWQHQLQAYREGHGKYHIRGGAKGQSTGAVNVWQTNEDYDYLLGTSKKGAQEAAVDVGSSGCYEPFSVWVDSGQNIWAACGDQYVYDGYTYDSAESAEFSSGGSLENSYGIGIPSLPIPCTENSYGEYNYCYIDGEALTGASNGNDVFQLVEEQYGFEYWNDYEYYAEVEDGGIYWTPKGGGSATLIPLWSYTYNSETGSSSDNECNPTCDDYSMDVDGSGNIWFVGEFYVNSEYVDGVAEITNPTTSPSVSVKQTFGTTGSPECPEYTYISHGKHNAQTLNITDSCLNELFMYPMTGSSLGAPTEQSLPENVFGIYNPEGIGYGTGDKAAVVGDEGWTNYGKIATDTWSTISNLNFGTYYCCTGAALTPSDRPF